MSLTEESFRLPEDIDTVMANQSDLVEIVAELKAIMCIKG